MPKKVSKPAQFGFRVTLLSSLVLSACDPTLPPACKVPEASRVDVVAARTADEVLLTPETLQGLLFDGNLPIHLATNRLHMAKDQMNLARSQLLPSVNLSALLFASGQPQFAWTGVSAVVPFLIPSNWFNAAKAHSLLDAEKYSLQIIEQNEYASATSMISLWLVDQELFEMVKEEAEEASVNLQRAEKAYELGLITIDELNRAIADHKGAEMAVANVREMVVREEAALRRAMGLRATVKLRSDVASFEVKPTDSETWTVERLVAQSMKAAPEAAQLSKLLQAAREGRWEAVFGFTSGVNLNQQVDGGKISSSLDSITAQGNLSFGAWYFPQLQLSNRNVREMQLRQRELELEFQQLYQGLQAQLESANLRVERATDREKALKSQWKNVVLQLELGIAEQWQVREAEERWRDAQVDSLRQRTELRLARLTWQRTLQEGTFAKLSPCIVSDLIPGKK